MRASILVSYNLWLAVAVAAGGGKGALHGGAGKVFHLLAVAALHRCGEPNRRPASTPPLAALAAACMTRI